MGGGDLNMKKSWHPVLLSNQARVWEVEKKAHEEKKKLDQLRKEIEEERQLLELQRLQEESTGRKRVEKLDWMYASPATAEGGALGGAKLGEQQMEDYLLGKKRVHEVLKQNEENIGATSEKFQAVQNANDALDIASKIREDPLLAIKRQEQVAYQAMMNNPALRKQVKEMKRKKEETKEERKERKRREKEEKRSHKEEKRSSRHDRQDHGGRYYSDEDRGSRSDEYERRRSDGRPRSRSPRRDSHRSSVYGGGHDSYGRRDRSPDDRDRGRNDWDRPSYRRDHDRYDTSRRSTGDRDGARRAENDRAPARPAPTHHVHPARLGNIPEPVDIKPRIPPTPNAATAPPANDRAARLAQMAADAESHTSSRLISLEQRRKEEELREQVEAKARERYGKQDTKGAYVREQEKMMMGGGSAMGLGDVLGRRGGKGLLREDV